MEILLLTNVSSLGRQFVSNMTNFKDVKRAYQALSLDDHRGAFTPSLWYLKDPLKKAKDKSARPLVDLKDVVDLRQCWFPGTFHSLRLEAKLFRDYNLKTCLRYVTSIALSAILSPRNLVIYANVPTRISCRHWWWLRHG